MKKTCAKILIMALVLQSVYLTVNVTNESAKAATLNLHNPTMINGVSTWDCVYFGTYWQNDTNEDGVADQNDAKEPIKWRVLQVDGDDVFLMSDKNLDCQKYNNNEVDITWETCSLRTWLYSNFYQCGREVHRLLLIQVHLYALTGQPQGRFAARQTGAQNSYFIIAHVVVFSFNPSSAPASQSRSPLWRNRAWSPCGRGWSRTFRTWWPPAYPRS